MYEDASKSKKEDDHTPNEINDHTPNEIHERHIGVVAVNEQEDLNLDEHFNDLIISQPDLSQLKKPVNQMTEGAFIEFVSPDMND